MPKPTLLVVTVSLIGGWLVQAEPTNDLDAAADHLVISAAQPLPVKEKELRDAVVARCREMLDAPAGKFGAHPSAKSFPGAVATDASRISVTLAIQHTPPDEAMVRLIKPLDYSNPFAPTLHSTGL